MASSVNIEKERERERFLVVVFYVSRVNVNILASTSVPFRPTTVKMPNLGLVETTRITVCRIVYIMLKREGRPSL